jgi:hypothetical protein
MKPAIRTLIVRQVLLFLTIVFAVICAQAAQAQVPVFQVDPSWPRIPGKWVFGLVSGLAVDEQQNHVWVIHL